MGNEQKIKTIFFIYDLGGGGAERVMVNILRNIDRGRFEPILYLISKKGSLLREVPPDVAIHSFDQFKIPKLYGLRFIFLFRKFVKHLNRLHPDVIVSFMWYPNAIAVITGKLYGRRVRTIVSERTSTSAYSGRLDNFLRNRAIKNLYPRADFIVSPSHGIAESLISGGIGDKKITVIHNPVDINIVREGAKEPVEDPAFAEHSKIVLAIGRLGNEKGFDYLVRAVAILKKRNLSCRLVILGEGMEREALERLIQELEVADRVKLAGFKTNPYKYLAQSTVFVLSSLYEGFPNVLLEALALGIPSVATRCPTGPEEIIEDGVSGVLVAPGDAQALAEAIGRLLQDERLRQRLGEAGRRRAEDFGVEKIVRQYEEVIESVCAGSAAE